MKKEENAVFEAVGLTKRYKTKTALENVNLTLGRGQIYGLIGANGAGKTTLMRIITGLDLPTQGRIALFGQTGPRALARARTHIGALIERPVALDGLSAKQNLKLERMLLQGRKETDPDALLRLVHLGPEEAGRAALGNYSLGMRQRYGLASALLGEPDFLVLDEPGTGLDPEGMRDLEALLLALHREKGTTMLISGHILQVLVRLCTDFIVLDHGRVIRQITHAQLSQELEGYDSVEEWYLTLVREKSKHTGR